MMRFKYGAALTAFVLAFGLLGNLGCDSGVAGDSGLPSPKMVSPANNSADNPNAVFLVWQATSGADTYTVALARDEQFSDIVTQDIASLQTTLVAKDLDIGVRYYWHVRASNADGESAWSPTWNFTPTSIASMPAAPVLIYPESDATAMPTTIPFAWQPVPGAVRYELHISMEPGMERRVADLEVRDPEYNIRGLVEGYTYYWRVRSLNARGTSGWSEKRRFVCFI